MEGAPRTVSRSAPATTTPRENSAGPSPAVEARDERRVERVRGAAHEVDGLAPPDLQRKKGPDIGAEDDPQAPAPPSARAAARRAEKRWRSRSQPKAAAMIGVG
jgi:hypothetical protein